MTDREAFMESILSEVEGEYFAARPQIDTADRRKVFAAGFQRAWQAACKYKDKRPGIGALPENCTITIE